MKPSREPSVMPMRMTAIVCMVIGTGQNGIWVRADAVSQGKLAEEIEGVAEGMRLNSLCSLPFVKRSVETFLDAARSVNHDPDFCAPPAARGCPGFRLTSSVVPELYCRRGTQF